MCRSVRIEGRATPISDTSSASRKRAPQSTSSVPQARLLSRSGESLRDGDGSVDAVTRYSFGTRAWAAAEVRARQLLFDQDLTDNVRCSSNICGRPPRGRSPPSRAGGDRPAVAPARAKRSDAARDRPQPLLL